MNPYRLWALVQQGVLGVVERWFTSHKTSDTLAGAIQAHLGPHQDISISEVQQLAGIGLEGKTAGALLQTAGEVSQARIPSIPAIVDEEQFRIRTAVEIVTEDRTERIAPDIVVRNMDLRDAVMRLAEEAVSEGRLSSHYDRLAKYIDEHPDVEIQAKVVLSVYREVPIAQF